MTDTVSGGGGLSRRHFLRVGFWGGLALSTVSATAVLTGCSTAPAARGFRLLRDSDLKVLRALVPVVLEGALPPGAAGAAAVEDTLHTLDGLLYPTSEAGHKQVAQLFDLLALPATRYTLAGLSEDWGQARPAAIAAFLARWRDSRAATLRAGYAALTQMINMAWYLQPRAWAALDYQPPHVTA